jgi:hypothetical protein
MKNHILFDTKYKSGSQILLTMSYQLIIGRVDRDIKIGVGIEYQISNFSSLSPAIKSINEVFY